MKMKTVIVMAFAVGCGLVAMMGVQQMLAEKSGADQDLPVRVLVASEDIDPGVLLSDSNCEFKEFPRSVVPEDAVLTKEDYFERGLLVPVQAGDMIRQTKLGNRGDIAASASVPKGMRTATIQVNDTKTHSGLLQPGDRIDLQVTFDVRDSIGHAVTKTAVLLEYIEVFASDSFRNMEAGESKEIKAKNVTFLVTPEQANVIQLANTKGELTMVIRNRDDKELIHPEGIDEKLVAELKTGMIQDENTFTELVDEKKTKQTTKMAADSPAEALKKFLANGLAQKQPQKVEPKPEPVKAEPEFWTIQIYSGEEIINENVALPVSAKTLKTETLSVPKQDEMKTDGSVPTEPSTFPEMTTNEEVEVQQPAESGFLAPVQGLMDSLFSSAPPEPQLPELTFPETEEEAGEEEELEEPVTPKSRGEF